MSAVVTRKRCAVYTRVSTDERLDQSFNSLDAQREAGQAYIASQRAEGWLPVDDDYDDGGYSGGNMERPALKRLMNDIMADQVDIVVVYKIDRLTRSLADFARLIEVFERHKVSFVSVTQQFNTTTSMGRLMLNILLSFAQFEREVTGERIRDKIAASKRKGMWMGGYPALGYDVKDRQLVINEAEAATVRRIFQLFAELRSATDLCRELALDGITTKAWKTADGKVRNGTPVGPAQPDLRRRDSAQGGGARRPARADHHPAVVGPGTGNPGRGRPRPDGGYPDPGQDRRPVARPALRHEW
jgi:DNA invertase Pin-like site-specific DNA recombinase